MQKATKTLSRYVYNNKLIWSICNEEKLVYITFDDGPDPDVTPKVLEILDSFNVKATFFCLGSKIEKHPNIYNTILAKGHKIGNHGYFHKKGWFLSKKKFVENVEQNHYTNDSGLFRPAYGAIRPCHAAELSKHYKIIMWSLMSKDYSKKMNPDKCYKRLKDKVKPGDIIVFHDTADAKNNCLYSLSKILNYLKTEGYNYGVL